VFILFISRDLRSGDVTVCWRHVDASTFQAQLSAVRRSTFAASSRSVSIPPCLRPIDEEEASTDGDAAASSISSSDEISCSDDELSNPSLITTDNNNVQVDNIARRFDDISSADVSLHNGKGVIQKLRHTERWRGYGRV